MGQVNLWGEELPDAEPCCPGSLRQRFIEPPFSVLNTQAPSWQERKKMWRNLGIQSELGRGEGLAFGQMKYDMYSASKTDNTGGTSIFDPVLCEIMYHWFCPTGGDVLDPFAGGSVRGIVAAHMGHGYTGIDLSGPQVQHNEVQADEILTPCGMDLPVWYEGDALDMLALAAGVVVPYDDRYDLIFTCPPYHDLEVYSEHPGDLSNMPWPQFVESYSAIISNALQWLRDDRFAVFTVGNVRDKAGWIKPLTCHTVKAFVAAGAHYYNRLVLLNAVGSARLRATRQFSAMRKVVTVHQDVLVFYKGSDAQRIKEVLGNE